MTKTTYAQQAAAAARKGDHDNASALYGRAAIEADLSGDYAAGRRHWQKARRHENLMRDDRPDLPYADA